MADLKITFANHIIIISAVVFTFADAEIRSDMKILKMHDFSTWTPVPWMGVVRLENENPNATEIVIPVIMITDKTAIADARSIASLQQYSWETIRNSIQVLFSTKNNKPWFAKLSKYFIHPQFYQDTLSSIALLVLEYDLKNFADNMLEWPLNFSNTLYKSDQIFTIGYTMHRDNSLEQVPYHMEYVNFRDCQQFYVAEKLDSDWMRPKHFHCYKVRSSEKTCVSIPGMALVHYSEGRYTLLGISVWGPGCVLPGRFVDFEPYVPWIMSKILTRGLSQRDKIGAANLENRYYWMIEKLNDSKALVLRPLKQKENENFEEPIILHGGCNMGDVQDGQLIYREAINFTTRPRPSYVKIRALAVFAVSLNERKYNENCIQILTHCKHRPDSILYFTKGFDEIRDPFKPFIKTTIHDTENPMNSNENKPYIHTVKDSLNKHSYEILGVDVIQLIFKFEFIKEANIEFQFYGNSTPTITTHHPQPQKGQLHRKETKKLKTPDLDNSDNYNKEQATAVPLSKKRTIHKGGMSYFTKKRTSTTKRPRKEENWWHRWWRVYMEKLPSIHMDWKLG